MTNINVTLAALAILWCVAAYGDCAPHWETAIGQVGMNDWVTALTVFDDGSGAGPALYAGGTFITASGVVVNRIAKWDGKWWSALGSGMNARVDALTVFDDGSGSGPALYAGGAFTAAGAQTANRIAAWVGCPDECQPPDLNCDGSVAVADLLILLGEWGPCADCGDCPADCNVGVAALLVLLANWTP